MKFLRPLGDIVKEGQELAPPPLRIVAADTFAAATAAAHYAESAARALAEFRSLHQPERTVYPNGTEVVLADRDGDVVVEIGGEYLYLDETQVAELASDLVWRAIKINPDVDWRLRAAHHALRDIHDDDDPWAS